MTEQTTELTDAEKIALAEQEKQARTWVRIQHEETARAQNDQDWKNLGSKDAAQGRDFVRRNCGFDPGW